MILMYVCYGVVSESFNKISNQTLALHLYRAIQLHTMGLLSTESVFALEIEHVQVVLLIACNTR